MSALTFRTWQDRDVIRYGPDDTHPDGFWQVSCTRCHDTQYFATEQEAMESLINASCGSH